MNRHLRVPPILPGIVGLALIVAIGALLIAGYGVPVGAGLMVGLLIGVIAGLAVTGWMGNRVRPASTTFDTAVLHAFGESGEAVVPGMPDPMRSMERVQRVDHGPLVRVVPGGASAAAGGVTVEVIALEVRATGAVAHLTAAAAPPAMMTGSFAQGTVEDDRGTPYEAAGFGGNGSPDRMRYELRFRPAPPPGATEIRIRIDAFSDPFPMARSGSFEGPWELTVPLREG